MSALTVSGIAMAFAPVASPKVATGKDAAPAVGIRVVRPTLSGVSQKALNGVAADVKVDAVSGAPRLIAGDLDKGAAIDPAAGVEAFEAAARAWIEDHAGVIGVSGKDLTLDKAALVLDATDQFLKFRVSRDGLKVQDATIDVRFKLGKLVQVANNAYSEAKAAPVAGKANLDKAALASVLGESADQKADAYRVVATAKGYQLVRVSTFDVKTADSRYVVQVDAATGKVFEIRPTEFFLDGAATGSVYPRYYEEMPEQRAYGFLNLPYTGGNSTTDADGRFVDAPAGAQPKLDGFIGTYVKVSLQSGTKVTATGSLIRDQWNVNYLRGSDPVDSDKNMAQSMVYWHTNNIIAHTKRYISVPWLDRQLQANVNLNQTCNAHWDGSTINLYSGGSGCANTGLISDVMYHEWGHGLDDNTGGIEDGGFSEGYGDVMSVMLNHSNILGIGFRTNGGGPVRDLEPDMVYPRDAGGEVHSEGLIIAGAFWDLFKELRGTYGEDGAQDVYSKLALKVISTASRYTDVYDALLVIDDDNGSLGDGTPNYCSINKAFAIHGLATADEGCNLAALDAFEVDDLAGGNGNGILEPGETATLWVTARNAAPSVLSDLTGALSVTGTGVSVTDGTLGWESIAARSARRSDDPAQITLDSSVACGATIQARVALTGGGRSATVQSVLNVGRLDGTAETRSATDLPKAIPDSSSVTTTATIDSEQWEAATTVQAAHLKLDLRHTYVGDLVITLMAPDGTTKEIYRGSGSGDDVHLDQDVTALLAGLKGKGTWTLKVSDNAAADTGNLDVFELTLTPARFECQ
jgi:subtilisin-like proprotein convertase family protein